MEFGSEEFPLAKFWDVQPNLLSPGTSTATFSELAPPLDPKISRVSELQESTVVDVANTDATITQSQLDFASKGFSYGLPANTAAAAKKLTHEAPPSQIASNKNKLQDPLHRSYRPDPRNLSSGACKKNSPRAPKTSSTDSLSCPDCSKLFSRRCERKYVASSSHWFYLGCCC